MNLQQIAAKANVPLMDVVHHLGGLGVHNPLSTPTYEPLFAACVITSLKPLDITKPTTPRIIRWFMGQK